MTAASICSPRCINITITVGIVLSVLGIIAIFSYPKIVTNKIIDELPLINGSDSFQRWHEMDVPITFNVYVFNVTNADEVLRNKTEKIKVQEIGPYIFKEIKHKDILSMDENEIKYIPRNTYYFQEKESLPLKLEDEVTFVNPPLFTAMNIPKGLKRRKEKKAEFVANVIKSVIKSVKPQLFEYREVGELLFAGFNSTLLNALKKMPSDEPVPDLFGLLYDKNDTGVEGNWTISTGKSNIESFAQIKVWNNQKVLSFWNDPNLNETEQNNACNEVKGSDGAQFSPSVSEKTELWAFVTDLCRTIPFRFIGNGEVMGVSTLKFAIPKEFYDAPSKFPQNNCFCTKEGADKIKCDSDGVMDVSTCRNDAPILMSAPHFWNAGNYTKAVVGLQPDIKKHQTVIEVEPWTGAVVKASRRLMVSIEAWHDPQYTNVTDVLALNQSIAVPLVWIEESAQLDTKNKDKLDEMLFTKVRLLKGLSVTIVVIGLITATIGIAMHFIINRRMGSLNFN